WQFGGAGVSRFSLTRGILVETYWLPPRWGPAGAHGWGERQAPPDRLDPARPAMLIDEVGHRFAGGQVRVGAQYADALLKILLARLSSRFSRSGGLSLSANSVGTRARVPLSISTSSPTRTACSPSSRSCRCRCDRRPPRRMIPISVQHHPHSSSRTSGE